MPPIDLSLHSACQADLITAKKWFRPKDPDSRRIMLIGRKLTFELKNFVWFETKSTYTNTRTIGKVFVEIPSSQERVQVATVDYRIRSSAKGTLSVNPVLEFLGRHGMTLKYQNPLEKLGLEFTYQVFPEVK